MRLDACCLDRDINLSISLNRREITALPEQLAQPLPLIVSQFGKMPTGAVQAIVTGTADPMACPPNPFDPSGHGAYLATCQGGDGYNGFYGHGQVNALSAVTKARSEENPNQR